MNRKFDMIGLFVSALHAMVNFYRDVIGIRIEWNGMVKARMLNSSMRGCDLQCMKESIMQNGKCPKCNSSEVFK